MSANFSLLSYNASEMAYSPYPSVEELLSHVAPNRVNWVTVSGISLNEDHATVRQIFNHFRIDSSYVEGVFRPDKQNFEGEPQNCLFWDYSILLYHPAKGAHARSSGTIVLGTNFLLLLEKTPSGLFEHTRSRIQGKHTQAQKHQADYLLHLLLKRIIINYQHTYNALVQKFEVVEDDVIGHPADEKVYDRLLELRDEFKPLYSYLVLLINFVNEITDDESNLVGKNVRKLFSKSLAREAKGLMAGCQYLRSWMAELIEIHRANVQENTNRVIKTLTVFSAVFLPLTFIAGIYGMNFHHMPELDLTWGYPAVLILMVLGTIGGLAYMKKREWL